MKTLLAISGIFYCFISIHDMPIATYRVYKSEMELRLEINFDRTDLQKELKIAASELTSPRIQGYIESHLHFKFDGFPSEIKVRNMQSDHGHLKIYCTFKKTPECFDKISIENTCLLTIPNQSNIIRFEEDRSTKARDFRMHKGRIQIQILR